MKIPAKVLHKRWIHSHEEDGPHEMVFRPDGFRFPPSRGREGFELRSDGSLTEIGIAPTDGAQTSQGTWELGSKAQLLFYKGSKKEPVRVLPVVSASEERLVVSK